MFPRIPTEVSLSGDRTWRNSRDGLFNLRSANMSVLYHPVDHEQWDWLRTLSKALLILLAPRRIGWREISDWLGRIRGLEALVKDDDVGILYGLVAI
jgi:hypothetical protein